MTNIDTTSKRNDLDQHYSEAYTHEAAQYDKRSFNSLRGKVSMLYKNNLLIKFLGKYDKLHQDSNLLDCPAGTGRFTHQLVLSDKDFKVITCADIAEGMLEINKKNLPKTSHSVKFLTANMKELPFEDSAFDAVIIASFAYLIPQDEYDIYLQDIARCLKPDGIILIEVSNPWHIFSPISCLKTLHHKYIKRNKIKSFVSAWSLKNTFKSFKVIEYAGTEFPLIIPNYKFYAAQSFLLGKVWPFRLFSGKFTVVLKKR